MLGSVIRQIWNGSLDLLMPPQCIACKAPTQRALGYCPDCWGALPANDGTRCRQCDHPLPGRWQLEALCLGCLHEPPAFQQARAPYLYDGAARETVLALKAGREPYAAMMAGAMLRAGADLFPPGRLADTVIVPVPLHRWRLLRRGFNQATALAAAIASESGARLLPDTLRRLRATPSSRGLGRAARRANVRGAFHIYRRHRHRIANKHVVLVDDVMTSGATASACARQLRRAGAASVSVLVFARVARSDPTAYLEATESDADATY